MLDIPSQPRLPHGLDIVRIAKRRQEINAKSRFIDRRPRVADL
ncbi:hypothetical protein V1289_004818 [Bradyrhizobium sp. AZCC 2289]